jgi:DNA-directed RNA polymerase subunit omega
MQAMSKPIHKPPSLEEMLEKVPSVYKLVNLAAKRTVELSEGSPKLVESSPKEKPVIVALREIAEGKVTWRPAKHKSAKS